MKQRGMQDGCTVRMALLVVVAGLAGAALSGCDKLPGKNKPAAASGKTSAATLPSYSVPTVPGEVIATVNGAPVTKGDLELRIQELKSLVANAGQEWKPLTPEQLQALLEDVINAEVMSQAASKAGLDQSVDVARRLANVRRQLLTQEWAKSKQQELSVAAPDIEKYYEENKQGFHEPSRVQVREIVLESEADAKRVMSSLYSEGADFAAVAQQNSVAPTAANGGLVDNKMIMRRQDAALMYRTIQEADQAGVMILDPTLESAVFSIADIGGFSNYAKGSDGRFHIFQLAQKQEGKQRELNQVSDNIKAFLTIQKVQEAILSLKNSASIERFPDKLSEVTQ